MAQAAGTEGGGNTRAIFEKASQHLVADSMQERREVYSITNISGRADRVGGAIMLAMKHHRNSNS